MRRSFMLAVLAVLTAPGAALAQAAAGGGSPWAGPLAFVAAGVGLGLAAGLCGLGQGRAVAAALEAIARQPGAVARIQTAMLIGLAFVESLTLYMFVVGIILVFKF